MFTKNTWTGNSGAPCYITNNDEGLYDVTKIDKLVQESSGSMSASKKGKIHMKAR